MVDLAFLHLSRTASAPASAPCYPSPSPRIGNAIPTAAPSCSEPDRVSSRRSTSIGGLLHRHCGKLGHGVSDALFQHCCGARSYLQHHLTQCHRSASLRRRRPRTTSPRPRPPSRAPLRRPPHPPSSAIPPAPPRPSTRSRAPLYPGLPLVLQLQRRQPLRNLKPNLSRRFPRPN